MAQIELENTERDRKVLRGEYAPMNHEKHERGGEGGYAGSLLKRVLMKPRKT